MKTILIALLVGCGVSAVVNAYCGLHARTPVELVVHAAVCFGSAVAAGVAAATLGIL